MKVRVPVLGTVGKSVSVESDAPSRAEVTASIQQAIANLAQSAGDTRNAYPTLWRLIREIPPNIQGLASLASTGIMVRTGSGTFTTRSVAVANTGRLTVANASGVAGNPELDMADISARSLWANATNASAKPAALQSSGDKAVPHQDGTTLAFSTIDHTYVSDFEEAAQDAVAGMFVDSSTIDFTYNDVANTFTADVIDNSITNAKLRQSGGLSVIGRSANTTGDVADIVAGANDRILRRVSDTVDFGQLTVGMFPDAVVTYAKIQNVSAASKLLGRGDSGAGVTQEITLGTGLSMSGTTLSSTATTSFPLLAPNGTAGAPSYSFSGDTNSGMYLRGSDVLALGAAGAFVLSIYGGANPQVSFLDGSASLPAISSDNDANTGVYWPAADTLGLVVGGTRAFTLYGGSTPQSAFTDGSASVPSISFDNDANLGIYRAAADYMTFSANGTFQGGVSTNGLNMKDGSAGSPSYTFDSDPNTGMARGGSDNILLTCGGTTRVSLTTTVADFAVSPRISVAVVAPGAGVLALGNGTATTAGAGSQTLPSNPTGFLVWNLGGSTIKIPYYNN